MSSTDIVVKNNNDNYQRKLEIIKSQVAKGATNDELEMFMAIANKYDLDPLVREIWFIKSVKKIKKGRDNFGRDIWDYPRLADGSIDYTNAETLIYTSRDGYLKVAQRDPNFKGILSMAVCEGDSFEVDAEHYKVTHKFGTKRGKIIGAWAKVDRQGRNPVISFVPIAEYWSDKSLTWKQYPTAMIIKVAEVLALKRQFGISGLVTREELSHVLDDIPQDIIESVDPAEIVEKEEKVSNQMLQVLWNEAQHNVPIIKEVMQKFNYKQSKDILVKDYDAIMADIVNKLKITPKQLKLLHSTSQSNKGLVDEIIQKFGYQSSKDIKKSDFEEILKQVEGKTKEKNIEGEAISE